MKTSLVKRACLERKVDFKGLIQMMLGADIQEIAVISTSDYLTTARFHKTILEKLNHKD